jgi:hypothetical protein
MTASAILMLLVGVALIGWLVWGGLAGRIADKVVEG